MLIAAKIGPFVKFVEPMGVHRELGSSSAIVCTPNFYVSAVATYRSAGFQQLPERRNLCRNA